MPAPCLSYLTLDYLLCICEPQFPMSKLGVIFFPTSPNRFHFVCLWAHGGWILGLHHSTPGGISFGPKLLLGLATDPRIKEEGGIGVPSELSASVLHYWLQLSVFPLHPPEALWSMAPALQEHDFLSLLLQPQGREWLPAVAIFWAPPHP